ncbi:hypothetical protein, partial [Bacillus sp. WP8]|uniref:hypothetical protein n=1 Tax=Bacillus sp. WP8 TaxID=756828 RepID=UPI0011A43B02
MLHQSQHLPNLFQTPLNVQPLPTHTSTHPPPLLLTQHPLTHLLPIQHPHQALYLTHYPINYLQHLPLLKIHFLPLTNLTLIQSIKN